MINDDLPREFNNSGLNQKSREQATGELPFRYPYKKIMLDKGNIA